MHRRRPRNRPEPKTSTCTKFSLFFLNVLFWLVGSIIVAFGIFVLVESKDYYQQLADISFQPAIFFFLIGAVVFIITFIGCIGSLRENTCLLCTYAGILTTIILLMVGTAVVGFLYKEKVENKVTSTLKTAIKYYRDIKKEDLKNLIDATQTKFKCCGAESYNDWNSDQYFNCSASFNGIKPASHCGVPFSCCLAELQLNRQCGYGIRKPEVSLIERRKVIYTSGCVENGKAWLASNLMLIGGVCIAVFILQLISIFLANKLREEVKEIKEMRGHK